MCIGGDDFQFSHKLPVTEGSSSTSLTIKADSLLPTKKSNFVRQHPINGATASYSQSITHKPSTGKLGECPKRPYANTYRHTLRLIWKWRSAEGRECEKLGSEISSCSRM